MAKPHITRTLAQIHFEDLDPHRFEDMLRELIYDFREWQSIESTGRGGSDDGFDVRAFEKVRTTESGSPSEGDQQEDDVIEAHPMDGNMWMIQAKREKSIGPARVREIVGEIDTANPPYGYILAAASNFSKESHDVFREELRAKGVMEFFLWSAGELEDMLFLPKNDRILFAFFGISLAVKRRTRVTSIRSTVSVKNKLLKLFGDRFNGFLNVLVRDIDDLEYPDKAAYDDFEQNPRWAQYQAFQLDSRGVGVEHSRRFAYFNRGTEEWDCTKAVDLRNLDVDDQEAIQERFRIRRLVEETYEFFPHDKQATYCIDALLEYENIKYIDEKGDDLHKMPHLYVTSINSRGPFFGFRTYFEVAKTQFGVSKDASKRIEVFPKNFMPTPFGKFHEGNPVVFDKGTLKAFMDYSTRFKTLWDSNDRYSHLQPRDYVAVAGGDDGWFIQVTQRIRTTPEKYFATLVDSRGARTDMGYQLGHDFYVAAEVVVLEIKQLHRHEIEARRPAGNAGVV